MELTSGNIVSIYRCVDMSRFVVFIKGLKRSLGRSANWSSAIPANGSANLVLFRVPTKSTQQLDACKLRTIC